MFKKVKEWSEKPLSMKGLLCFIIVIVGFYLVESLFCKIYDSDMYFLIATGREILENGIPYENIWSIDKSSGFVAQQWLYCMIIALADKIGYAGFTTLVTVQFIGLLCLLNHFFNLKNLNKYVKMLCIAVVVFYSQIYLFCTRPELITMILLLTECIALEHFAKNGNWKWLMLLPLTMIAEMNLHGSMWPMHFAIVLAYMVPAFYLKGVTDVSVFKKWKPVLLFTGLMVPVMFINPYGLDGILYIVKSFAADTFNYVNVQEIAPPIFFSASGLTIMLGLVFIFITYRLKTLDSVSLNIAIGFIALGMYASRNNMFAIFIMAYLLRCLGEAAQSLPNVDWKKDVKNNIIPILAFGILMSGTSCLGSVIGIFGGTSDNGLADIASYMKTNYTEDMRVFTGFNNGAYFEFKGFKNVYIDARPELYTDTFTDDKNILADYSKYCIYGFDTNPEDKDDVGFVTEEEMDAWFYSYDFDYVIVSPLAESYLSCYMSLNDDYRLVEFDNDTSSIYLLYERIK